MPNTLRNKLPFALALAAVSAFLLRQLILFGDPQGDTQIVIRGGLEMRHCLKTGQLLDCQIDSYFPLLQHIPAFLFALIKSGSKFVGRSLVQLNFASFVAIAVVGARTLRHRSSSAPIAWLLLLFASPLLIYTRIGFSEPLAALPLVLLTCALLLEQPSWEIFVAALFFGVSKETSPFAAAVLSGAIVYRRVDVPLRPNRQIIAAFAGCAAAFAINIGFNVYRFHHIANDYYDRQAMRVDSIPHYLDNYISAWLSPSGGVLFYWPVLALVIFAAALAARRNPNLRRPLLFPIIFLAVLIGGLSAWFGAFGWVAWGNRLLLSWMPAIGLIILWDQPDTIANWIAGSRSPKATAIGIGSALGIFALPQLLVTFDYDIMWDLFRPRPGCDHYPDIFTDAEGYYRCMYMYFWQWPSEWTIMRSFPVLDSNALYWGVSAAFVALFAFGFSLLSANPVRPAGISASEAHIPPGPQSPEGLGLGTKSS